MNDTVENLVQGLLDEMEESGLRTSANRKALLLLDARSADDELETLEEKVEDLEWAVEDYFTIDKDDLGVIVARVMRSMFYPSKDSGYVATNEEDYDSFLDEVVELLKDEFEKGNKNV